jgi:hypothetical protein
MRRQAKAQTGNVGNAKERAPGKGRRSVFGWLAITGEMGALVGPLLGAALLGRGFDAALAAGIAIFVARRSCCGSASPPGHQGSRKLPERGSGRPHRASPAAHSGA